MMKRGKIGMPYRLSEGELEQALGRARHAVAEIHNSESRMRRPIVWRWAVAASLVIAAAVGWAVVAEQSVTCDEFIAQMREIPQDMLYDMSVDIVEYESDITLL